MCAYKVLLIPWCRNQQGGRSRCILDKSPWPSFALASLNFRPSLSLSGALFQSHEGSDISSLLLYASFEFPGGSVGSIII